MSSLCTDQHKDRERERETSRKTSHVRVIEIFLRALDGVPGRDHRPGEGINSSCDEPAVGVRFECTRPNRGQTAVDCSGTQGSCKTVADPEALATYEVFDTPASRAGEVFTEASGDAIPQLGGLQVPIVTRERPAVAHGSDSIQSGDIALCSGSVACLRTRGGFRPALSSTR